MKKVLFIILAAFAVFSCSKEDVIIESEPQPFKYVFNVAEKPSFDVDTKAVKESWVTGDKIRIVFDDKDMSNGNCFTTLEYKESGKWIVSQGSIKPNAEGGTLDAIYLEKRGGTYNYYGNMVRFEFADEVGQYFYLTANDVPYTVKEDNTVEFSLSLDFETSEDRTYAQFRVTGLEGNWNFILEDSNHEENSLVIWSPIWSKIDCSGMFTHETISLDRGLAMGVRDDGHYKYLSVKQDAPEITITLQNADTGEKYYKSFSKKISGKCAAITFKGPQFDDSGACTNGWNNVNEQPDSVIYYTSTNGDIITPYDTKAFGVNITNNEYVDGRGIMTFDGPVTSIGDNAFSNCSNLAFISLPKSVRSIRNWAFLDCSNLSSIFIPELVSSFGSSAFAGCSSMTSITIPNLVRRLEAFVFSGCSSLTSITIPESVTYIGEAAFSNCSSLSSIVIPNSVTRIESVAFRGCSSLSTITIPESVTGFGSRLFANCPSLTSINGKRELVFDEILISVALAGLTSYTIPESVSIIGEGAFEGCSSISSVIVSDSVTDIGKGAFLQCRVLSSITIPNSVTNIGDQAFGSCSSLQSITIPNSVTNIGDQAFMNCGSLTSISIPNSVTSIGNLTFWLCSNLASITIPNSVTSIGRYAFYMCSSLTAVSIPETVDSLGEYAFGVCNGLTHVILNAVIPPVGGSHMFYETHNCPIYVPAESVDAYKVAEYWSDYADRIQAIPE